MLSTPVTRGKPNPLHHLFADRLRKARRAAGLTAAGLSDAAGIGNTLVGQLEAGRGLPLLSTAERLADALRCSPGWLCYGVASPWEPAPDPAPDLRCSGLAARLRQLRTQLDLSLSEVGRRAGSSAAAVRSLESGTVPTIATAEQLALALRVSPAWLAFGDGPRELPRRGARPAAPAEQPAPTP